EAVAAYFSRVSWMFDLNRRWDGSFVYDCLYGEGPNSGASYHDFKMSTAALLTYALPHRKLRITGKGHDAARYLSSADVAEAVAADDYDPDPRSDSQLISDLANWSPVVRKQAAVELSTRSISSTELSQITAMANDTGADSGSRAGACLALGEIGDSSSAATLAALLSDADNYVRFSSAEAMRYLPTSASLAQVDTILAAAASTGAPLYPMVEEDPLQFAHGRIAILLFYSGNAYGPKGVIWGSGVNGIDRGLLYPAIEAIAKTPIGFSRSTLGATYDYLTEADVLALSGTIVDSITDRAPADRMFSNGVRSNGVEALQRFDIAEGVPACMIFAADEGGGRRNEPLTLLGTFGGGAKDVDPDPDVIAFLETFLSDNETVDAAQASIDAINGDSNPTPLDPLKAIVSVTADDPTVTLPATSTTLRVTATDHAQGDSVFSWRKLSGAGTVSFEQNGTAAAATNTLTFTDGGVGTYEFEVTMSDSRGLTEVYDTVTVTLAAGSGPDTTAPTPNPMTWASAPSAVGNDSVTMTATTASDGSGVEYYFTCTSGPGNNSGWQDSPSYTDTGLAPGTQYTYTVMARDKSANQNATAASGAASATTGGTAPPLKIYILAGQSNMEGHGEMEPIETQGTLQYQVENDPSAFAHLKEGGGWASRGDTWIWYKRNGTDVLNGNLSAGYGRYDHTIGPELQFGIEMGNAHGEQVLLIKTAWGGKSLYTDFRPPSSGWSVNPPVAAGDQGFYYQEMLSYVNDVLTNLSTYFPNYNSAAGYELAGFGWHQGWNDRIDADAVNEYEANLENLINDVRSDLGVPGLPFVIANTGMGGWAETGRPVDLMNAQLAMADPVAYPAFAGNVAVVDTRDFWRDPANSPSQTQSYHWNRNAETYFLIGQSMALGLQSLGAGADTDPPNPNPASFAVAPHAPNDVSVTMTASAGSDISGPVEYLFTETSGNTGGSSSGWQTSATYTDTELLPETTYTYTVTLRDSLGNVGIASAEASASTVSYLDVFPPTPNPAGFAVAPTAASATSIGMVAEEGFDESGPVEYLFTETSGNPGGDSSGWQLSPSYTDTGLTEGVQYTYTVTLRDALGNVGAPSQSFTAAALGSAGQLGVLDLSTTNGGINPVTGQPWAVGDTYRIAFVTDGTRDATSPDIADYDA
ncbi:MAG: sialate O-acetylesterase, partial [Haloferula sp.]